MKQKFLILSYSFQGKFRDDENGPANLKQYIAISPPGLIVQFPHRHSGLPEFQQEGPLIHTTLDTLEECEAVLRNYKGPDALFVLPIFELENK